VLPPDDWPRLAGTILETVWPNLDPSRARVLVVEEDGRILGCMALLSEWHLEGAWIDPARRQRVAVLRRLLKAAGEQFRALDIREVFSMATSEDGRQLVQGLGPCVHLNCDHFAVNVTNRWPRASLASREAD
jgi:hypothetical protein